MSHEKCAIGEVIVMKFVKTWNCIKKFQKNKKYFKEF